MRFHVLAAGRMGTGPEALLYKHYAERLPRNCFLVEITDGGRESLAIRRKRSTERLLKRVPDKATCIALDERGKALPSLAWARHVERLEADGVRDLAFLIGGDAGLDRACLGDMTCWSLGPLTWPHLLARVLLVEQLYRITMIRTGSSYHRGD